MKVQFENERKKIAERIALTEQEKQSIDGYKKEIKTENLSLSEKLNAFEYQNKELVNKVRQVQQFLNDKESECDELMFQNEANKKALKQSRFDVSQIQEETGSRLAAMMEELNDFKVECEDLAELVKTKDRMLEDQLQQIYKFKSQIQEKNEEILQAENNKSKYREYYDDKLA